MLVILRFKTPDVVFNALQDVPEEEKEHVENVLLKFVKYGENVTIMVDTATETATIVQ